METAVLVRIYASYTNSRKKRKSRVNSLFRKLYGYNSFSNYSRYNKRVNGLIDNIPSIRYDRGIVTIRNVDISKLEKIIRKHGADYKSWKVIPNEEETKRLKLNKN
ncbi:MAG: hypothetical protein QW292_03770 [Candidatus Parvarchaeota archaeon]